MEKPSLEIGNSNWAIKEGELLGYNRVGNDYLPIPITMTRASLGTRVNPQGLVETVELLGSELVTNGDFATDTNWTTGTGWDISGGTANCDGSQSSNSTLTQQNGILGVTLDLIVGRTYKMQFDATVASGFITNIEVGGNYNHDNITTTNSYTLYFVPSSTNDRITFTANPDFVGSIDNVSVKEATIDNLARVDYTDGTSSLLVEPQRRNLVTYSEELQSTSNVTLSNTISPDGTLNGLKINETTSNSQHYATSYEASVVSGGTIYTVSFYIKKGTYDLVKVYTQSSRISASINITFSTESTSASGSDFISGSNFMEDTGSGWYRVGFSATANTTGAVSVYLAPKDLSTYVGDISQYTEYWGVQIEEGSYATSYIPTSGGTVTRVQDQYSKTGISNLIGQTEGTFFIELSKPVLEPDSYYLISLNNAASNSDDNSVTIGFENSNDFFLRVQSNGTDAFYSNNFDALNVNTFYKIAVSYKSGQSLIYIDGSPITPNGGNLSNAFAFTATLDNLSFDFNGNNGLPFYGKVKQLQVFKTALSDSELATLTT